MFEDDTLNEKLVAVENTIHHSGDGDGIGEPGTEFEHVDIPSKEKTILQGYILVRNQSFCKLERSSLVPR